MAVVGIVVVLFAVSNHSLVLIDFWPLPFLHESPIYMPVLIAGIIGFLFGGIVSWFSASSSRKQARKAKRQVSNLEKDLVVLQNKIDDLDEKRKNMAQEH